METAKLRFFAGIGGALFGFAGLVALMIALVIGLSSVFGWAWATLIAAVLFLGAACACLFVFLQPQTTAREEIDSIGDATADVLADLPMDAIKAMVEKRPIFVTGLAAVIGYGLARDPSATGKTLQRTLLSLL